MSKGEEIERGDAAGEGDLEVRHGEEIERGERDF